MSIDVIGWKLGSKYIKANDREASLGLADDLQNCMITLKGN